MQLQILPTQFLIGDNIPVNVKPLTVEYDSLNTSLPPINYYEPQLNFCRPKDVKEDDLFSPLEFKALKNETCSLLCSTNFSPETANYIRDRIRDSYVVHMQVDGLNVSQIYDANLTQGFVSDPGFELGRFKTINDTLFLAYHNHYNFYLYYHLKDARMIILSAYIIPKSQISCGSNDPLLLNMNTSTLVNFTYSVSWIPVPSAWLEGPSKHYWVSYLLMYSSFVIVIIMALIFLTRLFKKEPILRFSLAKRLYKFIKNE